MASRPTLPIFKAQGDSPSSNDFSLMQTKWRSILGPLLGQPTSQSVLLTDIALKNGATVINHTLGQTPQGWRLTDINGVASIYRSAPFDPKTLTLTSNAAVTVSLEVF